MIKHLEDAALMLPRMTSGLESSGLRTSSSGENDAKELQRACQQFEAFFIYYLLKVMRQSVPKANLLDGSKGEEIYQSLMDQEMARKLASSGGIGLAALLLDRLDPAGMEKSQEEPDKTESNNSDKKPSFVLPIQGTLSSPYGMRTDPFTGAPAFHHGIDLAAVEGAPVKASGSGRIIQSGKAHGYGNYVMIDHGDGYTTLYAHLLDKQVSVGEQVAKGEIIGRVGKTGRATGPHLHFEVQKGEQHIDPGLVMRTSLASAAVEGGML